MKQTLRHGTGAAIRIKTKSPAMFTKVNGAVLITTGVSPVKETAPTGKHLTKVA